jgi:hypothetical protein
MESQIDTTGIDIAAGFAEPQAAASSCCSTAEQEACCTPAEKAGCCGTQPAAGDGCGCR